MKFRINCLCGREHIIEIKEDTRKLLEESEINSQIPKEITGCREKDVKAEDFQINSDNGISSDNIHTEIKEQLNKNYGLDTQDKLKALQDMGKMPK